MDQANEMTNDQISMTNEMTNEMDKCVDGVFNWSLGLGHYHSCVP